MATSWKTVAERLASRLASHACCETHPENAPVHDCPFCDDRIAYAEYIAVGGIDHRPLDDGGSVLTFEEWKRIAEQGGYCA